MTTGIPADAALDAAERVPAGDRRSLARSAALLSAAWIVANLATYLLSVVGSRVLGPGGYGVLGPLLGVLAVVSVPGLALQTFVARRSAREAMGMRPAVGLGVRLGAGGAVLGAALVPALAPFLHVERAVPGLAASLVVVLPLAVVAAAQGCLQGREQFGALSVVVLGAGAARLVGGVVPLLLGADAGTTMVGVAVASALLAVVAAGWLLRRERTATPPPARALTGHWRELAVAVLGLGGLLLLANLDLLIARQLLGGAASGRYAVAAVVSRVALWLPQAVSLAVLPRLAHATTRLAALRDAAAATLLVGAAGVVVTAAAGGLLIRVAFGGAYRSLGGVAWLFAAQGAALALVQLLVVDDIARARRGILPVLAAAAIAETAALETLDPGTVRGVVEVATLTAVAAAGVAVARLAWETRRAAVTAAGSVAGVVPGPPDPH